VVNDAQGCFTSSTINLVEPPALSMSATIIPATTGNSEDGFIVISPQGGVSPYNVSWSTGATGFVLNDLSSGTYTATLTDSNGCMYEENFSVQTTPIEEISALELFQIQPNPSNGIFQLKLEFTKSVNATIRIFNPLGQILEQQNINGNTIEQIIDIRNEVNGIYFIELKTMEGRIVRKLVKQ